MFRHRFAGNKLDCEERKDRHIQEMEKLSGYFVEQKSQYICGIQSTNPPYSNQPGLRQM